MRIIVPCEESQAVVIEFRKLGHEAYSCDTQECSGGHPEWHIRGDALIAIKGGVIILQDGSIVFIDFWDMLIGFPPCTYMSKAGARWMFPKAGIISLERYNKAMEAKEFFLALWNSGIDKISLENPFPLKVVGLPKETQTIQPYQFGHAYSKKTLLWLKNLPPLQATKHMAHFIPLVKSNTGGKKRGQMARPNNLTAKETSKTFPGIARAMAEQWSNPRLENNLFTNYNKEIRLTSP